jgi:hypothetical protein
MAKKRSSRSKRRKKDLIRKMKKWEQMTPEERTLARNRSQAGEDRRSHFENGGDLASWRGRASVFKDRRKERDKRQCRSKITEDD